ncbi:polymerase [Muir Springs virus]|uniref:Replicase n=2 Tax=Muir Springs virus TaxID=932700 RepID=A0A0D3R160_9RHAB|nr:polymerase [Muir Springs virus]AJR28336.1 polymerase [Muir Springs virus]
MDFSYEQLLDPIDVLEEELLDFDLETEDLTDDEVEYLPNVKYKNLEGKDYNLNSPLISDLIDSGREYILNLNKYFSHERNNPELDQFARALKAIGFSKFDLKKSSDHHRYMSNYIYNSDRKHLKLDIIPRWKEVLELTRNPVEVTIKHVLGSKLHSDQQGYIDRLKYITVDGPFARKTRLHHEWEKFTTLHYITYIMNSKAFSDNKDWVREVFETMETTEVDPEMITIIGTGLNKKETSWIVSDNFALNVRTGLFIAKDFLLMMKDITLARCMSKLSMVNRKSPNTTSDMLDFLDRLYSSGDNILTRHGNMAYKHIKLLEAACLERWNQLGHKYRPLIPISNSMSEHLKNQLEENQELYLISNKFFELIEKIEDPWVVAQAYGTFRHWGHPYIDYLNGLKDLEKRVNEDIKIDRQYTEKLASDLAFIVLKDQFSKHKRWFARPNAGLSQDHPIRKCIENNVWPNTKVILDFGDNWHKLELLQCFEIPDAIDLSDLYSDKAHSMQYSDVLNHIRFKKSKKNIPALRVIGTLLEKENPNIKEFLQRINDHGLDEDDLIIGLKAKERELKDKGRFFSLMSWNIRLYFVITEYLIKLHFVPLFSGLTVADDLNTVTKKLLSATEGQGLDDYEKVYIANSLDYEKWNNRQRYESNEPVFTVMGKFLGYPKLISYTHKIFENSFIYYNGRMDLMGVDGNVIYNLYEDKLVCWQGQLGGFEGVRQKGWSVLNYLILRREAATRNTAPKFLAQGDNQIVITQYTLTSKSTTEIIQRELKNIWENNMHIMQRIQAATGRIGLVINNDEVLTSAELLVYGKIPVFRGKLLPLETKRWSRVSTVTNEQIPSFSNSLASSTTTALAVNQHSENPIEVMAQHHFFSSFAGTLVTFVNPILGFDPIKYDLLSVNTRKLFLVRLLYKDPSVGGVCGTNLLRFFISRFPDPLSETLTWWKILFENTKDLEIATIALECGNPKYGSVNDKTLAMLLEDPMSLNIPGGLSSDTMIKNKIYEGLINQMTGKKIKNELVVESLTFFNNYKDNFVRWLFSIRPIFPRFISEFYTSTYFYITESVLSIFQNSRTIRKVFSSRFPKEVYMTIVKGEQMSIRSLLDHKKGTVRECIWACSASKADEMRKLSWGRKMVGITTPHPAEFTKEMVCSEGCTSPHIVAKKIPFSGRKKWTKGRMMPYLGTKTKESTSILQPWEKRLEIPLLRKACDLRKAIRWFVNDDSNLAKSIYKNLESMTGIDLKEELRNYRRTGSSKHRLRNSRVSNEGNPAISYNNLTYVTVTTDSLGDINSENYDFMYQSILCWCGVLSSLPSNINRECETTHFHLRCDGCFRTVEEEILDAPSIYPFPNVQSSVRRMLTQDIKLKYLPRISTPDENIWETLSTKDKSWHIGRAQGFLWGLNVFTKTTKEVEGDLFPTSITKKVDPENYMDGLHRGFCLGATLSPMYTRYGSLSRMARLKFEGAYWEIVDAAMKTNLPSMIDHHNFRPFLKRTGGDLIKSYPARKEELVLVLKKWFLHKMVTERKNNSIWESKRVIAFADMDTEFVLCLFRLAESILCCYQNDTLSAGQARVLGSAKETIELISKYNNSDINERELNRLTEIVVASNLKAHEVVDSQARHAASSLPDIAKSENYIEIISYDEFRGYGGKTIRLEYQPGDMIDWKDGMVKNFYVPRLKNPLISGVRIVQYSTGAHYKYKDIEREFQIKGDGIFSGDGSGGIGANHLRLHKNSRVIFNSKLELEGDSLKGLAPAGPGAYTVSGEDVVTRCINYSTCWEEPSDLSDEKTWKNFLRIIKEKDLDVEVFCCDAEVQEEKTTEMIEDYILRYVPSILNRRTGTLIYKTYFNRLLNPNSITHFLGMFFHRCYGFLPTTQGSFTSEIYIICQYPKEVDSVSRTELTYTSIAELYNNVRVMETYQNEFARACGLIYDDMTYGLGPKIPFLDPEELAIFLSTVGLDTGWALLISEQLHLSCSNGLHPIIILWILGFIISRHLVSVTSWFRVGTKFPPSVQLQKMLAALFGIWFGISYIMEDVESYARISSLYNQEIFFSLGLTKVIVRKKDNKELGQFSTWKIGPGKNSKLIDIGPKAGITQSMIRALIVLYRGKHITRDISQEDKLEGDRILSLFGKGLNLKILMQRTGINYLQVGEKNPEEIPIILEEEIQEETLEEITEEFDQS